MFSWFRPRCPVDPVEKAWVEKRMGWLTHVFGLERMRQATIVLPTPEFFPDAFTGKEADVPPLLGRVCKYMGMVPERLGLDFFVDNGPYGNALGIYLQGPPEQVLINRTQLKDPLSLVGTLAHEVGHALLLGDGQISRDSSDHELVTDLLTVFLGMGVFGSNCVIRESFQNSSALYHAWSIGKQGYLSEKMYGYALALFSWMRGEKKPIWRSHLRPNVRAPFTKGLDYLERTGDSLCSADTPYRAPEGGGETGLALLLADLRSPAPARRLGTLWDLKRLRPKATAVIDPLVLVLRDPEPCVRREAAEILGTLGRDACRLIPTLLEAAQLEDHRDCRQALVQAAIRLGAPADAVVPVVVHLIQQEPTCYATQDFHVAGELEVFPKVGYFAELRPLAAGARGAVPVLIEALQETELVAHEAIRTLGAIGSAAAAAEPHLLDILDQEDGELRGDSVCALAEIGVTSPEFIAALRKALREAAPGQDIRVEAAWALGRIGTKAAAALRDLEKAARADDLNVRLHAVVALAQVDGRTVDALRVFHETLPAPLGLTRRKSDDDEAVDVYSFVLDALGRLSEGTVAILEKTLKDPDRPDRVFAAWALGQFGPKARAALSTLRATLGNPNQLLRVLAACSSWAIAGQADDVVPVLLNVLQGIGPGRAAPPIHRGNEANPIRPRTPADVYRNWIPRALITIGRPAVPVAVHLVPDFNEEMKEAVVRILGALALKSEEARHDLENRDKQDSSAQNAVRQALKRLPSLEEAARKERLRRESFPPSLPLEPLVGSVEDFSVLMHDLIVSLTALSRP